MSDDERSATAPAKLNLMLLVGAVRDDGKHEVLTLLQRIELADELTIARAERIQVEGFADDSLVTRALDRFAAASGVVCRARIEKRIPVAAGLGGGSSDAATALRLANELAGDPLAPDQLHRLAASLGSDVPFFLFDGAALGRDDGTTLERVEVPLDYWVVLVRPHNAVKESTAAVYHAFDARRGPDGFDARRRHAEPLLGRLTSLADLAQLPPNDLATSSLSARLVQLGAQRADVTGAGPVLYGLFADEDVARFAAQSLTDSGETWLTRPRRYR